MEQDAQHPITEAPVLVTGASGFIARHLIVALIHNGYRVRGTVRSLAKQTQLFEELDAHTPTGGRLELCAADLTRQGGWAEAMRGVDYVLHTASPFPLVAPRHDDELVGPARDGALRVLNAARTEGVRRVVMTSSFAAMQSGHLRDGSCVYGENDWAKLDAPMGAYERSKAIAERAAWDFVEASSADKRFEFVAVNPGFTLGPCIGSHQGTSNELIRRLLLRAPPALAPLSLALVDVRDVAELHLRAMTSPAAPGRRFACGLEQLTMKDIAQELTRQGYRVPRTAAPKWAIRAAGLFDGSIRMVQYELGKRADLDARPAREILGWKPRPIEQTLGETARGLIEAGLALPG
jgi:dihydroflavonol-4-reductase